MNSTVHVTWRDPAVFDRTKVFVSKFIFYRGGTPQRSDTDVHSVVTTKTSAVLWQQTRVQRCNSDGANSNVTALTVTALE